MKIKFENIVLRDNSTKIAFNGELIISCGESSSVKAIITASIVGGETKRAVVTIGDRITLTSGAILYRIICSHRTFFYSTGIIVYKINGNELWNNMISGNSKKPFELDDIDNNDLFSKEDKENIKRSLNELHKTVLSEFGKNETEKNIINDKLDYIIESLNRQGKKDWMHTSIGVFATLASSLCLSGEQTAMFWQMIKELFGVPIKLLMGK